MFETARGTTMALTTPDTLFCGNVDYQRFNIHPDRFYNLTSNTRTATARLSSAQSSSSSPSSSSASTAIEQRTHISTERVCYQEDETRRMCTLAMPMCSCGQPLFVRLHQREAAPPDSDKVIDYIEALYLDNTYCYMSNPYAWYPTHACIGVLLDSNGNSIEPM